MTTRTRNRVLTLAFLIFFVPLAAVIVIRLAQGYRPDIDSLQLQPRGLLVATSEPDGAQVFINGKLTTATNNTLNLVPNTYEVEIKKDPETGALEYDEFTVSPDAEGKLKDVDFGIEDMDHKVMEDFANE